MAIIFNDDRFSLKKKIYIRPFQYGLSRSNVLNIVQKYLKYHTCLTDISETSAHDTNYVHVYY